MTMKSIVDSVSDWIKLLALIVLVVEAMLVVALAQSPDNSPVKPWYPVIMLGPLLVIIIGIFVDRHFERPGATIPVDTTQLNKGTLDISVPVGDTEAEEALNNLNKGIIKALKIDNPVFRRAVMTRLHDFLGGEIERWRQGEIVVQRRSGEFLLGIYKNATRNIFSTSNKEFSKHWSETYGERILKVHSESEAEVTRVFIFDEMREVTEEDYLLIKKQHESNIDVRIYFDKEDNYFQFPSDIARDFTVIDDGDVIGITESFSLDNYTSVWHFRNQNLSNRLKNVKTSLLNGSMKFQNFEGVWMSQASTAEER